MLKMLYVDEVKALTIKGIPEDVLNGFKAWCALRGKNMQQVIIQFMREHASLIEEKPRPKPKDGKL